MVLLMNTVSFIFIINAKYIDEMESNEITILNLCKNEIICTGPEIEIHIYMFTFLSAYECVNCSDNMCHFITVGILNLFF